MGSAGFSDEIEMEMPEVGMEGRPDLGQAKTLRRFRHRLRCVDQVDEEEPRGLWLRCRAGRLFLKILDMRIGR